MTDYTAPQSIAIKPHVLCPACRHFACRHRLLETDDDGCTVNVAVGYEYKPCGCEVTQRVIKSNA